MEIKDTIQFLSKLALNLQSTKDLGEKQEILLACANVQQALTEGRFQLFLPADSDLSAKIALFSLAAIGQEKVVLATPETPSKEKVKGLLQRLISIDHFYESIGGIVGYHVTILKLLADGEKTGSTISFKRAPGTNLAEESEEVRRAVLAGIRALPEMGEVYPIGGLGARLDLKSKTGEPLPAACLDFGGRTLLEGLIRDVQAREFLYYKLFGKQITVPIAMMTSLEKRNAFRVRRLCEKRGWYGRPKESFFLFAQLSVPVVTQHGHWSMRSPLELNLQPGGHGALWRTAEERGVFEWFHKQGRHRLLIRQINNPIGGIDRGLLALIGIGKKENKTFGFASCERLPHAAEGVLVQMQMEGKQSLSNIEYTDFQRFGIEDCPAEGGFSPYPANTNILYADLKKLLPVIQKRPLPGLTINMKMPVPYLLPDGKMESVLGGRLESMMQNISDGLVVSHQDPLPTFLTYNARHCTISATKRSFQKGKSLLETPEGAFYDQLFNAHVLLEKHCGVRLPPFPSQEAYLNEGPAFIFAYHPALGPLYEIISQKIRRGSFTKGSELQLEIADVVLDSLNLDGSLLIQAENLLGHRSQGIIRYSERTGKCVLRNVAVKNRGINPHASHCYWKNSIKRTESLKITLKGRAEFYAEKVIFQGNETFIVPDGERWIATQGPNGSVNIQKESADWQWRYMLDGGRITLRCDLGSTCRKLF